MTKSLGFEKVAPRDSNVADMLKQAAEMKPAVREDDVSDTIIARMIDSQPEVIRQTSVQVAKKRKSKGITNPLNMRVRLATFNRYVTLSDQLNKTYDETLEYLLNKAGVDIEGIPLK